MLAELRQLKPKGYEKKGKELYPENKSNKLKNILKSKLTENVVPL